MSLVLLFYGAFSFIVLDYRSRYRWREGIAWKIMK